MSIGFLLKDRGDSVVWRGPKKDGMIRQFLAEVRWGDLDYLVIDTPPGKLSLAHPLLRLETIWVAIRYIGRAHLSLDTPTSSVPAKSKPSTTDILSNTDLRSDNNATNDGAQ